MLGDYYYYDSTVSCARCGAVHDADCVQPTLRALWRSFTQCKFIESAGDIVFFKNMQGRAVRECTAGGGSAVVVVDGEVKEEGGVQDEKVDVMVD